MSLGLKWALAVFLFCCSVISQENGPDINDKKLTKIMDSMNKRIKGLLSTLNSIENNKLQGSEDKDRQTRYFGHRQLRYNGSHVVVEGKKNKTQLEELKKSCTECI